MALAADSPTLATFIAGEGRSGTITFGPCGNGSAAPGSTTSTRALGKSRSTPWVAYVSTVTFPACVRAILYLPRLNPATGIARSDTQWEACAPALSGATGAGL